jgi:hypothetical protein
MCVVASDCCRFNYHTLDHRGEHLPSLYAIPRPWTLSSDSKSDREAAKRTDLDCYSAFQRWKHKGCKEAFRTALVYSLRWLTIVADSVYKLNRDSDTYPRDWSDAIGICVEASHDAILELRSYDPIEWGDDIELHPDGAKYRRHRGRFRCQPYVRYIRDGAQRAIDEQRREYHRVKPSAEMYFLSKHNTTNGIGEKRRSAYIASDVEQEVYARELLAMTHDPKDADIDQPIWLDRAKWIKRRIPGNAKRDVLDRAILETKMRQPELKHNEIAAIVARETGIQRGESTVGRTLKTYSKGFADDLGLDPKRSLKGTGETVSVAEVG